MAEPIEKTVWVVDYGGPKEACTRCGEDAAFLSKYFGHLLLFVLLVFYHHHHKYACLLVLKLLTYFVLILTKLIYILVFCLISLEVVCDCVFLVMLYKWRCLASCHYAYELH